jgi:hypothetical protein
VVEMNKEQLREAASVMTAATHEDPFMSFIHSGKKKLKGLTVRFFSFVVLRYPLLSFVLFRSP